MIHLESVSLSVWLVCSTIPELWAYRQCAVSICCLKFCLLVSYESQAIVWSNAGRKSKSGNYFPKQVPGYFWCSFSPGRKSFYLTWEYTYHDQQVMVVSVRFHFSEVHFQVLKGQHAFQLNPQRFLSMLRDSTDLWAASVVSEILSCIGKRGEEPRNIFKLALPVYHGLDGLPGVLCLPQWVPAPPVPITCHLAIPTIPFLSWWPFPLWLVGFGLQCILETPVLAQAALPIWEL